MQEMMQDLEFFHNNQEAVKRAEEEMSSKTREINHVVPSFESFY
jgi:hypothetical protein